MFPDELDGCFILQVGVPIRRVIQAYWASREMNQIALTP
jgi:hypothetical protein